MSDYRNGTVVLKEKKQKGIIRKRTVYGGGLYGAPGIYGYSINQTLNREYQVGEKVHVRYQVFENDHRSGDDEYMEFEILEESEQNG